MTHILEQGQTILESLPLENRETRQTSHQLDGIVASEYVLEKVNGILRQIEQAPFGHFAISGPPGSGKMATLTLTHELYQRRYHSSESQATDSFIVVTLEETFDSKNLVGTYVCNETGEFVFKKGPLTVAAEQGLWLILRNIEDTPSDLLSFLLPLIEHNVLQVTSTFTIKPKLGFRIFVMNKSQSVNSEFLSV